MKYLLFVSVAAALLSCKKEDPKLGDAPTADDAQFSVTVSAANPNIIDFASNNQSIQCRWDFGNGSDAQGNNVSATYPYAGTYTVTLTVFNNGGSRSSSQDITIDQDDLSLLNNPIYNKLTGGTSGPGFKTWYIDSVSSGHMGVGPDPESALGPVPEWWAAGPGDKGGCGLYDDRYVFSIDAFGFDMITNGDVYVNNELQANFPGSFENLGDFTAPFADRMGESWLLTQGTDDILSISGDAFLGFYTGLQEYRILELSDTTMSLQYDHHAGGLHWYLLLKTE
jgi:PKD repeat protein